MKLLHYKLESNKYYKDNIEISEEQAKKELIAWRFQYLLEKGYCNVRQNTVAWVTNTNEIVQPTILIKETSEINKDLKPKVDKATLKKEKKLEILYEKYKDQYRVEVANKKCVPTVSLFKMSNYGYYTFIKYIDIDDSVKQEIINDILENKMR